MTIPNFEESIRSDIQRDGGATSEMLRRIDAALEKNPSAALWILRGDAIQLNDVIDDNHALADAEQSYLRAIEIDPSSHEAHQSLGYFYYAVMDDAAKAQECFERAIAFGGGESASHGLRDAMAELRDRKFRESVEKINQKFAGVFRRLAK